MPKKRADGQPRGRMSSYAFFVQSCREEHKKKHPGDTIVFGEFTKKCAEQWKEMSPGEKKRFESMADKDKQRYDKEMANYNPPAGGAGAKRGKQKKDPNAPKRALSAFFMFCAEERPKIRSDHPDWSVGDIAKKLGKLWEACKDRSKFEALAAKDKKRYEQEMAAYKGGSPVKRGGPSPKKQKKEESEEEEDDDDDEDEDDDDDDEDDE